ncbi:hypothetical protein SAMN05661080_00739 [Modestobacter sp. DSM 44400]|uniref:hypothetical protein n=1 Tax=Modestobacter sp. DSM 44400 TaxID=1550230 RepID=UPI00089BF582|nr:hypothetical protein [Modestobacter sp. DSM 44400]SDX66413.1 hypothetical protein SAMN05661080_00739 [Modestobacter sp. DSM 44400]
MGGRSDAGTGRRSPGSRVGWARARWPTVLLLTGLAVQLAPWLLLPVVLTQDGPAHVDGAWVLLHHGDDGAVGELLRTHYAIDLDPVPNMLTTALLALLLAVLTPGAAEKVVVAGFVVLLVAGLHYALRGVHRRAGWLAVAALPLAGSELVVYGFYNFCWGVALALFAMGWALRRRDGWTLAGAGVLSLLLLLTWSAHLLPYTVATVVVAGLGVGRVVSDVSCDLRPARAVFRHLAGPAVAVLPSLALSVGFLVGGDGRHGAAAGWPGAARVASLLTLYRPLVVGSWWEIVPSVLVAGVLAGLLVRALRPARVDEVLSLGAPGRAGVGRARADRVILGTATALSAVGFLLSPEQLGEEYGFLSDRLAWFPPLLLVLFCATAPPTRVSTRQLAAGCLVVAATAAVLVRLPSQLHDQRDAAEVLSVAADLPAGATFAVLRFSGNRDGVAPVPGGPDPLRHLSSGLAVRAQGVDIGHYEAIYPYFQVRFADGAELRRALDPGLDGLDAVPPWVHLAAVTGRLDYVLVVGLDRAQGWVRHAQRTTRVLADLRAGYVEVARSHPSGHVSVWRLQGETGG